MALDGHHYDVSNDSNTAYYGKEVRPTDILVKQSVENSNLKTCEQLWRGYQVTEDSPRFTSSRLGYLCSSRVMSPEQNRRLGIHGRLGGGIARSRDRAGLCPLPIVSEGTWAFGAPCAMCPEAREQRGWNHGSTMSSISSPIRQPG